MGIKTNLEKKNVREIFFYTQKFFNLHYDYWDLIPKFWPGSTKWNTPFGNSIELTSINNK